MLRLSDLRFILHFLEDTWTLVRIFQANRIVVPGVLYSHLKKLDFRNQPKEPWSTTESCSEQSCAQNGSVACNKLTKLTTLFMILRT